MAHGYMGSLLWVDLTSRRIETEQLPAEVCRDYIGGYGIAARLLYQRQKPHVHSLGPDNTLGFLTGPLTGTRAISSGRFTVVGKSPLTGTWGDSNCGGYFGPYMKFAGIDGVFFTGASETPVYLYVNNGRAELKDADHLWGKDSAETQRILMSQLGEDIAVACIGPAGERISLIAAVMSDVGRAAGRSGLGAVMGSKQLKAIAVAGNQKVSVDNEALLKDYVREYLRGMGGYNYETFRKWGTAGVVADSLIVGDTPIKNWGGAYPDDFSEARSISDDNVTKYQLRKYACWHCPIACGGHVKVPDGPYAMEGHKPEYETIAAFGPLCLNHNIESIFKANDICNLLGLDTISAGAVIAFAIECFENGVIGLSDTDGIELTWGNHESIVAMTEKIGKRQGFGDVLADGVKVAAQRIGRGAEQFAMHIHGQEMPMHDAKLFPGLVLTYQYDATPARHTQGCEDWPQPGLPVNTHKFNKYGGRAGDHLKQAAHMHVCNCAGICQMGTYAYDARGLPDFIRAVTGWDYTLEDVWEDGERIHTLRHLFNLREGYNPREVKSPGRTIGRPPLTSGPLNGITVDLDEMAREFYALMDWDLTTSMPSDAKLRALGLKRLVDEYGGLTL